MTNYNFNRGLPLLNRKSGVSHVKSYYTPLELYFVNREAVKEFFKHINRWDFQNLVTPSGFYIKGNAIDHFKDSFYWFTKD